MLRIIAKSLRAGVLTEADPFGTKASFGFPVIDFSRCVACDECARVCLTGAIKTGAPAPERKTVTLSYAACIQCRDCVSACPENAIAVSPDGRSIAYTSNGLITLSTPSRISVFVTGSILTSVVFGTCLMQTIIFIWYDLLRWSYSALMLSLIRLAAMTFRCIWLVPSYIWVILASLIYFSTG